jgi:hypothetical protein
MGVQIGTYIWIAASVCSVISLHPGLCYLGVQGKCFLQLATQAFGKNILHDKDGGSSKSRPPLARMTWLLWSRHHWFERMVTSSSGTSSNKAAMMDPIMVVGVRNHFLGVGIRSSLLGPPTTGQLATARLPPLGGWVIYL